MLPLPLSTAPWHQKLLGGGSLEMEDTCRDESKTVRCLAAQRFQMWTNTYDPRCSCWKSLGLGLLLFRLRRRIPLQGPELHQAPHTPTALSSQVAEASSSSYSRSLVSALDVEDVAI